MTYPVKTAHYYRNSKAAGGGFILEIIDAGQRLGSGIKVIVHSKKLAREIAATASAAPWNF
jgi:hypothetical protein